jgi:hypothetical protein
VQVLIKLILDGSNDVRMPVSNVAHANSGNKIHITFTIRAKQKNPFRTFDRYQVGGIRRLGDVLEKYRLAKVHSPKLEIKPVGVKSKIRKTRKTVFNTRPAFPAAV